MQFLPNERFNNPHFSNCYWTKQFFSEVIKWFNAENATSLRFSRIEIMFGRKLNKKNAEQYPERKLNFTLLFAKYYLYNTKLFTWGNLHDWFHYKLKLIINIHWKV